MFPRSTAPTRRPGKDVDQAPAAQDLSVVVPVGRDAPQLRRCLESIRRLSPPPLEVLVVLDGPAGERGEIVDAAGFETVTLPESRGPAAARNEGARRARGRLLLFLDSDVTVPPDLVDRSVRAFHGEAGLAALIGSYDDAPGDPAFLSQYRNLLHHHVHQTSPPEGFTFWGACGVIRRDVFLASGGFDERYREPSVEDIELGYRLREGGHRIRLVPSLQVKHWKRWGSVDLLRTDVMRRGVPWMRLILRHRRLDPGLNLRVGDRWSAVAALGIVAALALMPLAPGPGLAGAGLLTVLLVALNLAFYRFLWSRRGLGFALRAIPLHLVFHVCSGASAVAGAVAHVMPRVQLAPARSPG